MLAIWKNVCEASFRAKAVSEHDSCCIPCTGFFPSSQNQLSARRKLLLVQQRITQDNALQAIQDALLCFKMNLPQELLTVQVLHSNTALT